MVTKNHVLIPVLPLVGDLSRVMAGGPPFAWQPEKPAMVAVMSRAEGVSSLRWFSTDPAYVFHPMNAYEADGKIYADVMKYERAPLFPNADGTRGENVGAYLVRWIFDLSGATDTIREEPLDDMPGEFPRFDERRSGLAYRHGWFAAQTRTGKVEFNALAHIDLATGARSTFILPEGDAVSEPVFVPRSADAAEGDGWVTAVAYRGAEDVSEFLVFEAQDMAAGPIASAKMSRRMPFGFHGNWVSA
jgi:carotenoid cleavage dioxygenase